MLYNRHTKLWVLLPMDEKDFLEEIDLYKEDHDHNTFYY